MTNVSNVKVSPVICWSVRVKTCSFLRTSWQVTSTGSTGTTQRQNGNRHSKRFPRLRDQKRGARCEKNKGNLTGFFLILRVSYTSVNPRRQTINKDSYLEVLRRLHESVRRKWPEKWRVGDWILHHDNVPAHPSHIVQQFLANHGTAYLQKPPYSPDVAPCDFFLFPRLKKCLKGHRFEATENIKT